MIKSITVTNHLGESTKLELAFPEKSGFAVQEIAGLGPPKADINMTDLATDDGSRFNSSRVTYRNIVLTLVFIPSPTIERVRQKSYKYFPIKKQVKLTIETDERICEIYGNVESNDPSIFSRKSGTQISIVCPDPYFHSAGPDGKNVAVFSIIEPMFEFEFSNEYRDGVVNGRFDSGISPWAASNSTLSIENSIISATGLSAMGYSGPKQLTDIPATEGRKVYAEAIMRVTNSLSTTIKLILYDGSESMVDNSIFKANPVQDQWYTLSGIITVPAGKTGNLGIAPRQYYQSEVIGAGKVLQAELVRLIDLSVETSNIEFGDVVNDRYQTIYYEGDADIGIAIIMHAVGPVENITIYNTLTRESMKIDTARLALLTGTGFDAGDTITISTVKREKYVTLLRNGEYINILNCLDKNADWFQLSKGDNIFAYQAETGEANLEFRIENIEIYEGV